MATAQAEGTSDKFPKACGTLSALGKSPFPPYSGLAFLHFIPAPELSVSRLRAPSCGQERGQTLLTARNFLLRLFLSTSQPCPCLVHKLLFHFCAATSPLANTL